LEAKVKKRTKLDRPAIRILRPGEKVSAGGIIAERMSSGDVRYSVNIMVDGQRIHRVIGLETEGVTLTQAREFIAKARTEAREGRLNLPKRRKTPLSFTKAADEYIEKLEHGDGKNIPQKQQQLRDYMKPYFGSKRLDTITDFTVGGYKKARQKAGAATGTINRELAVLNHLYSKAVEWKWIAAKPFKVKLFPEGPGRIVVLTDNECRQLLNAAVGDQDHLTWLFVLFGLNTCMRHMEILTSRFENVDAERRRLFIADAKAGARHQPITRPLVEAIEQERQVRDVTEGWIFPSRTHDGYRYKMRKQFRRTALRAGLDPDQITPHVMRHTGITRLVQGGVDLETVRRISGHKTLSMVLKYTHISDAHIDEAIDKIAIDLSPPKTGTVESLRRKNLDE
jgi:integrase